jgi:hypothetical protein
MKVYLSGPMRGIPEFNFPAFFRMAETLLDRGHEVFNPAEHQQDPFVLSEALKLDLGWICAEAEAVAFLPDWEFSLGARAEHALAVALGLKILYLGER